MAYASTLATIAPHAVPIDLRIRKLADQAVWCRPGTSDPWVLWDVYYYGYHRPPLGLDSLNCIVDLGANVGYATADFLCRYPNARVVAVEMDPANASLATRNTLRFGPRCEVLNAAIWQTDGRVRYGGHEEQGFRITESVSDRDVGQQTAPAWSLDHLFDHYRIELVDYLKMDIEGAEAELLRPPLAWAKRVRAMKVELHAPASFEDCEKALSESGFYCARDQHHPACLVAIR